MLPETEFRRLTLSGFRQFGVIDLDLSNRLTVLTGANGAGKTTLLGILGSHFNWHASLLANPRRKNRGSSEYSLDIGRPDEVDLVGLLAGFEPDHIRAIKEILETPISAPDPGSYHPGYPQGYPGNYSPADDSTKIGQLQYKSGEAADLLVPKNIYSLQYNINVSPQGNVPGVYLSSHRTLNYYQAVTSIPAEFARAEQILSEYTSELRSAVFGGRSEKSSMLRMKESLLAAAIYGEGNKSVRPSLDAQKVWFGFQEVLAKLFPPEIGFQRLVADPPEIVIETNAGEFSVDSLSGGLSAIFELAWQIHLRAASDTRSHFTVCFDEPENHLHPSLQRTLMPALLRAFPNVSFIVATHSPFITGSAKDASVYALQFNDEGKVVSLELDFKNKAKSAEKVLTDVLGVTSTSPIWAEEKFNTIIEKYTKLEMTRSSLLSLRSELEENGLGEELPMAVETLLGSANNTES